MNLHACLLVMEKSATRYGSSPRPNAARTAGSFKSRPPAPGGMSSNPSIIDAAYLLSSSSEKSPSLNMKPSASYILASCAQRKRSKKGNNEGQPHKAGRRVYCFEMKTQKFGQETRRGGWFVRFFLSLSHIHLIFRFAFFFCTHTLRPGRTGCHRGHGMVQWIDQRQHSKQTLMKCQHLPLKKNAGNTKGGKV